jgi:phage terminase small subunit
MTGLTPKQQLFVREYLVDLNATAAYRRAGYEARGNSAEVNASRLLSKAKIFAAIQEAFQARAERTRITQDRVLLEYARLAFSDLREVASWNEHGITWHASEHLTDDAAATIKDIAMTREIRRDKNGYEITTVNTHLKLHDKRGALHDVAKHLGMFPAAKNGGVNVNVDLDERRPQVNLKEMTDEELEFYERWLAKTEDEAQGDNGN